MIKKHIVTATFLFTTLVTTLLNPVIAWSQNDSTNTPSPQRQQELTHLLKQDCGSCHGMTLKGGLGPALLPENLVDKPDYVLVGTIKYGRETLAMPAWDGILTTAEIEWLVSQLKSGNALANKFGEKE